MFPKKRWFSVFNRVITMEVIRKKNILRDKQVGAVWSW